MQQTNVVFFGGPYATSLPNLPVELIRDIAALLSDDEDAVLALAGVCRFIREATLSHFTKPFITAVCPVTATKTPVHESVFAKFLVDTQVASLVKTVVFCKKGASNGSHEEYNLDSVHVRALVRLLPNVKRIIVRDVIWVAYTSPTQDTQRLACLCLRPPLLENLDIVRVRVRADARRGFTRFLCDFHPSDTLTLGVVTTNITQREHAQIPTAAHLPVCVIDCARVTADHNGADVNGLYVMPAYASVRELLVRACVGADTRMVSEIMQRSLTTLTRIAFDLTLPPYVRVSPMWLWETVVPLQHAVHVRDFAISPPTVDYFGDGDMWYYAWRWITWAVSSMPASVERVTLALHKIARTAKEVTPDAITLSLSMLPWGTIFTHLARVHATSLVVVSKVELRRRTGVTVYKCPPQLRESIMGWRSRAPNCNISFLDDLLPPWNTPLLREY